MTMFVVNCIWIKNVGRGDFAFLSENIVLVLINDKRLQFLNLFYRLN